MKFLSDEIKIGYYSLLYLWKLEIQYSLVYVIIMFLLEIKISFIYSSLATVFYLEYRNYNLTNFIQGLWIIFHDSLYFFWTLSETRTCFLLLIILYVNVEKTWLCLHWIWNFLFFISVNCTQAKNIGDNIKCKSQTYTVHLFT